MSKTLYLSDLDGTLLNRSAELSETTRAALNAMLAKGLHFSAATARTAASGLKILAGVQWNVPLILMNGVLAYDTMGQRYTRVLPINAKAVAGITRILKRLGVTGLLYQLEGGRQVTYYETLESEPLRAFVEERVHRYGKVFTQTDSFAGIPPENTVFFAIMDTESSIRRAYDALSPVPGISRLMYRDVYNDGIWYLELHSGKASKQSGVEYLREEYGYDRVICFGDNLNDLPMFAASDLRVAVANALPEVKAAADFICGSNEDDGVVRWIAEREGL
jgi:Cof subfamily protein (haloacid dehalogenase superfamily)